MEVYQVLGNGLFDNETYYFACTDEDDSGWYLDDEYCLLAHRMNGSTKILQNDIIRVYGRVVGTQQFERALTSTPVEIPVVEILYSDLIEE